MTTAMAGSFQKVTFHSMRRSTLPRLDEDKLSRGTRANV